MSSLRFSDACRNMPEKPKVPTVLFQHNVEAMIWRRHFEVQRAVEKAFMKINGGKSVEYSAVCRQFRLSSRFKRRRDTMRNEYGIEKRFVRPTGVDTNFSSRN
jgi:hypothetical protein